ncbi:hypothetical protein C8F01DRAFT_1143403 [Mycena amicta]|nr:hypothetical protein C8F01DRAFT_1143403 [Mycena amicta]
MWVWSRVIWSSACPSLTSRLFPAFPLYASPPLVVLNIHAFVTPATPTRRRRRRRRRRSARSRANAPSLPRRPAFPRERQRVACTMLEYVRPSVVCRLGAEYKLEVRIRSGVSCQCVLSLSRSFSRPRPRTDQAPQQPSPVVIDLAADVTVQRNSRCTVCVDLRERDGRHKGPQVTYPSLRPILSSRLANVRHAASPEPTQVGVVLFLCNGRRSLFGQP